MFNIAAVDCEHGAQNNRFSFDLGVGSLSWHGMEFVRRLSWEASVSPVFVRTQDHRVNCSKTVQEFSPRDGCVSRSRSLVLMRERRYFHFYCLQSVEGRMLVHIQVKPTCFCSACSSWGGDWGQSASEVRTAALPAAGAMGGASQSFSSLWMSLFCLQVGSVRRCWQKEGFGVCGWVFTEGGHSSVSAHPVTGGEWAPAHCPCFYLSRHSPSSSVWACRSL